MPWIARLVGISLILWGPRAGSAASPASRPATRPPNVVYILADDLGIGDVRCFNPAGKIATPTIDRLAQSGMRFTDAHTSSAVCTPTRYGILTGRYSWRSTLRSGVLGGYSKCLIEPDRLTVAAFLHQQGYRTACFGKWHLGLDWATQEGNARPRAKAVSQDNVDYAAPFTRGPLTVGFDRFFGISASLDMPPFAFLRQDRMQGLPTATKTWVRPGPAVPDFEAIDVLPALVREANAFLDEQAASARNGQPFFLYVALTAPHTPILPTADWAGRSRLNPYADFVMQVDHAVDQVLANLDRLGLTEETLVIFASDNGCAPAANYPELLALGHDPSSGFRGTKADIFEGGHRVPFVVRWPGQVAPGSISDQVICTTDLFATVADVLGTPASRLGGRGQRELAPGLAGRDDQAAPRGDRAPFNQRFVRDSARPLEVGALPGFRRLERTSTWSG